MAVLDDQKLLALGRSVIEADARAVRNVLAALNDDFVRVARRICEGDGKLIVTGSGTSATIATRAAEVTVYCGAS